MKRCVLFFLTLFCGILFLSGCGKIQPKSPMRQVVDDSGQSLSLPSHPSRIVSLTYGTDEILLGLVDTSRVTALSQYAGNPDISFVTKEEAEAVGRKVDMNAESIQANKDARFFLNIDNLFNRHDIVSSSSSSFYNLGRNFMAGIEYTF